MIITKGLKRIKTIIKPLTLQKFNDKFFNV